MLCTESLSVVKSKADSSENRITMQKNDAVVSQKLNHLIPFDSNHTTKMAHIGNDYGFIDFLT